jgi:hypothetical protein
MKWMKRPGVDRYKWHPHFAWKPVQIENTDIMVWLEWVERMDWNGPATDPGPSWPMWIYRFPMVKSPPLRQSVVRMGDTTVRLPQKR